MRYALRRSSGLRIDLLSALQKSSVLKDLKFADQIGKIRSDDKVLLLCIIDDTGEKKIVDQGWEVLQKLNPIIRKMKKNDFDAMQRKNRRELYESFDETKWDFVKGFYTAQFVIACCGLLASDYYWKRERSYIRRVSDYTRRYVMELLLRYGPRRTDLIQKLMEYSDICLVCHDNHDLHERVILSCGHVYGGTCLEPWIEVGT